jgi:hypothetical protein
VHLSGEADSSDLGSPDCDFVHRLSDGNATSAPPVARILLRPSRAWRSKRIMIFACGGKNLPALIHDEGTRSARADINAQKWDNRSLSLSSRRLA